MRRIPSSPNLHSKEPQDPPQGQGLGGLVEAKDAPKKRRFHLYHNLAYLRGEAWAHQVRQVLLKFPDLLSGSFQLRSLARTHCSPAVSPQRRRGEWRQGLAWDQQEGSCPGLPSPPLPLLLFGPWSLSLNLLWLPYPLGFGGPGQGKAALCLHQWPGLLAWKGGSW